MVDPTSDLGADEPSERPNCTVCDGPIDEPRRQLVVTWVEDGAVQTRHFCDVNCRSDWDDERPL